MRWNLKFMLTAWITSLQPCLPACKELRQCRFTVFEHNLLVAIDFPSSAVGSRVMFAGIFNTPTKYKYQGLPVSWCYKNTTDQPQLHTKKKCINIKGFFLRIVLSRRAASDFFSFFKHEGMNNLWNRWSKYFPGERTMFKFLFHTFTLSSNKLSEDITSPVCCSGQLIALSGEITGATPASCPKQTYIIYFGMTISFIG